MVQRANAQDQLYAVLLFPAIPHWIAGGNWIAGGTGLRGELDCGGKLDCGGGGGDWIAGGPTKKRLTLSFPQVWCVFNNVVLLLFVSFRRRLCPARSVDPGRRREVPSVA